jgi:hypothetical protein
VHDLPHPVRDGRAQPANHRADADRAARGHACCRLGHAAIRRPNSPDARQRAIEAVTGAGLHGYDEAQLNADLTQPFEAIRPALNQVGAQLTVQAREWYLADVIRIGMADGPLTDGERQAALAIGLDLGMTHAQTIGVIATTEQSAGRG